MHVPRGRWIMGASNLTVSVKHNPMVPSATWGRTRPYFWPLDSRLLCILRPSVKSSQLSIVPGQICIITRWYLGPLDHTQAFLDPTVKIKQSRDLASLNNKRSKPKMWDKARVNHWSYIISPISAAFVKPETIKDNVEFKSNAVVGRDRMGALTQKR